MKITIGPFSLDILLLLRLWLPPIVFIVICTALFFLPFHMLLLTLDDVAPNLIGIAWLSLLLLYIIAGFAFIYFYARFLRVSFASEDARGRRNMAVLSGLPFYALCFLFMLDLIYYLFFSLMMRLPWLGSSLCLVLWVSLLSRVLTCSCYVSSCAAQLLLPMNNEMERQFWISRPRSDERE